MPMVVVHRLPYPRLLVFHRSVVAPTVTLLASLTLSLYMQPDTPLSCDALLFIPRLYAYHISHIFAVVILPMFQASSTS